MSSYDDHMDHLKDAADMAVEEEERRDRLDEENARLHGEIERLTKDLGRVNQTIDGQAIELVRIRDLGKACEREREAAEAALSEARAAVEKMRPVVEASRQMPRKTPRAGGSGDIWTYPIESGDAWALDRALKELDGAASWSSPQEGGNE